MSPKKGAMIIPKNKIITTEAHHRIDKGRTNSITKIKIFIEPVNTILSKSSIEGDKKNTKEGITDTKKKNIIAERDRHLTNSLISRPDKETTEMIPDLMKSKESIKNL